MHNFTVSLLWLFNTHVRILHSLELLELPKCDGGEVTAAVVSSMRSLAVLMASSLPVMFTGTSNDVEFLTTWKE